MDSTSVDTIKHVSNTEVIRRLLIKYFYDKGFNESFDKHLYPCLVQDLPLVIPVLSDKIEVVPYAEEVDSINGKVKIGWNMFVLGKQRMYLGETSHNNMQDLARQIHSGMILPPNGVPTSVRKQATPRRIITFITRILGNSKSGYIDLAPRLSQGVGIPNNSMAGSSNQFYTRNSYGT